MKRTTTGHIQRLILIALIGSPLALFPAWLSDKQGDAGNLQVSSSSALPVLSMSSRSSSQDSLADMRRGFFVPSASTENWPRASLIQADFDPGSGKIIVRWQDSSVIDTPAQGTRYAIYRGVALLSSEDSLDGAQRVGLVDAGVRVFTDENVPDGKYYYAVSVVDSKNIEYFKPAFDQNYTFDAVRVEQGVPIVTDIAARYEAETKTIQLSWKSPLSTTNELEYIILQSRTPFIGLGDQGVREVGRVSSSVSNYNIINATQGAYYHAILTRNKSGRQSTILRNGANVTDTPLAVTIRPDSDLPAIVTGINSNFDPAARLITLRWKYRDQKLPGLVIYHNDSAPLTVKGSLVSATPIHVVKPGTGETSFSLASPNPGNHFFSIISFDREKTNELLLAGENALNQPLVVPYPEFYVRRTNYIVEYVTNVRIVNVLQTNTNMYLLYQTNRRAVNAWSTNLNLIKVDRFVTNDRVIISDRIVTNERVITNTLVVTNQHVVNLTNQYKPETKDVTKTDDLIPRPFIEMDITSLRAEVKSFFRNRDRNDRNGLYGNIYSLRKLQAATKDSQVAEQCTLFIGQAYYYLGEYTTAFREFVKIKNTLPEESRGWINRCVERMR